MRTCNSNWRNCQHASCGQSSSAYKASVKCFIDCNYTGYCKYQLPNDDKIIDKPFPPPPPHKQALEKLTRAEIQGVVPEITTQRQGGE